MLSVDLKMHSIVTLTCKIKVNIMTQSCLHCIRAYNGEMPYTDRLDEQPSSLNIACDYELKLRYKVKTTVMNLYKVMGHSRHMILRV